MSASRPPPRTSASRMTASKNERLRAYVVKATRRHGWAETKSSGAKLTGLSSCADCSRLTALLRTIVVQLVQLDRGTRAASFLSFQLDVHERAFIRGYLRGARKTL